MRVRQAMGASCLNISLIELKLSFLRRHYRSCGLKSELVKLDNDTTMHCWTPTPLLAEAGVWSVPDTRPPLLLIQGFAPHAMLCWENQVASLVKEYNVYIPDLLFFGNSITACKQRSESFQAECMVKMLQHLGVRNEVDVVGTSYGGFVAFRMAQMFPEFVNKIVFSSSGVCMSPDNNEPLLEKHGLHHISQVLIPTSIAELKIAISCATYKTPWLPNFLYQDMLEVLYNDHRVERRQLLDELVIGTAEAFPLPKLAQEKMLIIWGEHDEIFDVGLAYKLQKHLGNNVEVVIMKNCGHVPQLENPRLFNRTIINFLKNQEPPSLNKAQINPEQ